MVEILLSTVPFGDVKDSGDDILRSSNQKLAGYGVGQYEVSFTSSGNEIVVCAQQGDGNWFEHRARLQILR
jgi:hypothetical protein